VSGPAGVCVCVGVVGVYVCVCVCVCVYVCVVCRPSVWSECVAAP